MEYKGYFSKFYLYSLILTLTPHLQSQEGSSLPGTAKVLFCRKFILGFYPDKGGQRDLPASAVSKLPLAQNNQYAKVGYLGVACSDTPQIH